MQHLQYLLLVSQNKCLSSQDNDNNAVRRSPRAHSAKASSRSDNKRTNHALHSLSSESPRRGQRNNADGPKRAYLPASAESNLSGQCGITTRSLDMPSYQPWIDNSSAKATRQPAMSHRKEEPPCAHSFKILNKTSR